MTSGVEPWTRAVCPVSMELGGGGDEGKLNDVDVVPAIETSIFSLLLPFTCMSSSLIGHQRLLFSFFISFPNQSPFAASFYTTSSSAKEHRPVSITGLMSGRRDAFHGSTC